MSETLIVINAGSSSLKFTVYQVAVTDSINVDDLRYLYGGQVSGIGTQIAHLKIKGSLGLRRPSYRIRTSQRPAYSTTFVGRLA